MPKAGGRGLPEQCAAGATHSMQHTRPPQAKAAVAAPAVVQVGGVGALLPWAAALVGILPGFESAPAGVLEGEARCWIEHCDGAGGRMLGGC